MMGVSRTRSAGAKVTEEEYVQLEALAQTRGLTVGEWCRDVLLAQLKPPVASLPEETILSEVVGLRMIMINLMRALGNEETLTPETEQRLSSGPTLRSLRQPWSACETTKRGETPSRFPSGPARCVVDLSLVQRSLSRGFGRGSFVSSLPPIQSRNPAVAFQHG